MVPAISKWPSVAPFVRQGRSCAAGEGGGRRRVGDGSIEVAEGGLDALVPARAVLADAAPAGACLLARR